MHNPFIEQDRYYPPTPDNLTLAQNDINMFVHAKDIGNLLYAEQALAESSRRYDVETPGRFNPYFDIIARSAALRHELIEQKRFEFSS